MAEGLDAEFPEHELLRNEIDQGEAPHAVAGRAFILHEKQDDFGQPTGNAGGRIGCGKIDTTE